MKYKTFRALVWTGVAVLVGLGGWRCVVYQRAVAEEHQADYQRRVAQAAADNAARLEDVERRRREAEAQDVGVAVADAGPQPAASGVPALVGAVGAQTPEAYLLATLGGAAREDKLKDVTGGQGAKINVYNEGGVWARAKVDHDLDEKWDEKWSLDGGVVVRQIAPNDDESYTRELRRLGDRWSEAGAASASAVTPDPAVAPVAPAPTGTGRPLDDVVLQALKAPVQEKIKDATGSTPYKVNLYSDDRVRWNRLKIDLDRDEKWDEKWTIAADGAIQREVAPADDEQYSETYVLTDKQWVRR